MKVVKSKLSGNIYVCHEFSEGLLSALRTLSWVPDTFHDPEISHILVPKGAGVSHLVKKTVLAIDYVELGPYTGPEEWADRGYYPLPPEELPQEGGQAIWIRLGYDGGGYEGVGYTFALESGALGLKLLLPQSKGVPVSHTFSLKRVEVYEWKSVPDCGSTIAKEEQWT